MDFLIYFYFLIFYKKFIVERPYTYEEKEDMMKNSIYSFIQRFYIVFRQFVFNLIFFLDP